jgi:aldehyde dehydrogenase (NAD+)
MATSGERVAPARYDEFATMPLGGRWRAGSSGRIAVDTDPWSGEVLAEIPLADTGDLDLAFAVARKAQRWWAEQSPAYRAEIMLSAAAVVQGRRAEIVDWLIHETGSTLARAELEWDLVRSVLLEAASVPHHVAGSIVPSDAPGRESRVYREPAGVVAVISSWEFPMHRSGRCVAAALAAGNAVVLKPASETPVTGGLLLARVLEEAGLPDGLLSVVIGAGAEIGGAIAGHPVPGVVSFSGSASVGERLARTAGGEGAGGCEGGEGARGFKRLALEFGSHGPFVVLDDADVERAADAAVFGSFFRHGQICMIANRLVVDRRVYDEFTERLVAEVRSLRAGDPAAADTDIGPLLSAGQLSTVQDMLKRVRDEGARQVLGGEPRGPTGLLLPPYVLLARGDVTTAREAVFGPVITVIRARSADDALKIANQAEYGRSGAVFTRDTERGAQFAVRMAAGMTHVNDSPSNDDTNAAIGGAWASGVGRFGGPWAVDAFTTQRWVSVRPVPGAPT